MLRRFLYDTTMMQYMVSSYAVYASTVDVSPHYVLITKPSGGR